MSCPTRRIAWRRWCRRRSSGGSAIRRLAGEDGFGGSVCDNAAGQLAFAELVNALRQSAGMDISVQSGVLSTPVPNAFALPGGRVYQSDGLPAKPMGELMFRVTGKEGNKGLSIASGHPLTEDRLARMSQTDRPASGPPLLTAEEWRSLKAICSANPWP